MANHGLTVKAVLVGCRQPPSMRRPLISATFRVLLVDLRPEMVGRILKDLFRPGIITRLVPAPHARAMAGNVSAISRGFGVLRFRFVFKVAPDNWPIEVKYTKMKD